MASDSTSAVGAGRIVVPPVVRVGAVAAGVDALLGLVGMYIAHFTAAGSREVGPMKLGVGELVQLALIVPEALVLAALLALAREMGSIALWRSSIGLFGCFWLAQVTALAEGPTGWKIAVSVVSLVGLVVMLSAVFGTPWVMAEPVPEPAPEGAQGLDQESQQERPPVLSYAAEKKGFDWSWVWIALGVIVGRLVLRAMGVTFDDAVAFALLLLILGMVGFLIWFGVTKLNLARRLGGWGLGSGIADLVLAGGSVGMFLWLMWATFRAEMDGVGLADDDPRMRAALVVWEAALAAWRLALAALLWSVWRRSARR